MVMQSAKPCRAAGCPALVYDNSGFCDRHADRRVGWRSDKERGNRHQRGLGSDYDRLRPHIVARDKGLCQPCLRGGVVRAFDQVDHIKPRSQGGENTPQNLECICTQCHTAKTAREARPAPTAMRSIPVSDRVGVDEIDSHPGAGPISAVQAKGPAAPSCFPQQ